MEKNGAQLFKEAINDGLTQKKLKQKPTKFVVNSKTTPTFLYAETEDEVKQLDEIYEGAEKVGVSVSYNKTTASFNRQVIL